MKKNKLYIANKWNRPAFMVDREHHNIFDGLTIGQSSLMTNKSLLGNNNNSNPFGVSLKPPTLFSPYNSWMSPIQKAQAYYQMQNPGATATTQAASNQQMQNFAPKENAVSNPLSFKDAFSKEGLKNGIKAGAAAGISAGAGIVGGLANSAISGGLESGAGSAISGIGSQVGSAVGAVNPLLGAAVSVGSQVLGGVTNALFGEKVNQAKLKAANESMSSLRSFNGNVGSFDDIKGPEATASVAGTYKGGLFNSSAKRKQRALEEAMIDARQYAGRAITNNVSNLADDQINNVLANFSAFGGPLDMGGGALDYGLAMDYLTMKKQQNEAKNRVPGISPMPTINTFGHGGCFNPFALGGDVQMHGADFTNGLMSINAGGSHEQNPNEGVQLGVDPEGVPNLVEEGETVFDDYVYSNRILADAQTKEKFGLPRKKDITFADISKKLEKESSERPNDPISQAGLKAQMHQLADEQERQKQEMDAQRAKTAFEALSPEEQVAVMENAAQQEAMAEQAAMQQSSPEEIAMAQQQQAMANGSQAALGQEPQMNCFGGRINRFDNGGQAYTKMLNSLGFHTQKEFDDWAKENSINFGDIWKDNPNILSIDILDKLWSNEKFKEALKKKNPALAHAFETKGYDFGTYVPISNSKATIQSISKGNWKATNGQGWFGSDDLAFKQATEGMSEDKIKALTTEQLAERMAKTDAYKNTSKWLEDSDNALMYLNTLLNDPDTPDVAKKHALQYVKDGKWKDGYKYNYNDVFGKVRSTDPGTYWHTAMEANRGNEANNFVINEDGSIEPILGNVPTDWTSAGNYSWADENSDYTYNYYKRPAVAAKPEAAKTPEEKEAEKEKDVSPKHSAEWLRYAGLFGPAVGLGIQMAGVGRPDTAQLDAAVAGAGDVNTAGWKPLGNYLTYRPLDIWFEQNRLNANARATDRAILNSGVNQGSKIAGLLAAGYNDQIASGNLFRQAQEYNDNLRKQVAEFNRGTDQFNSEQYGATSRFNADAYNNARRANAQLRLQAAAQKMDADAGWYNSLYGNIAGLFKGIGDIGTENFRMNRIGEMAARGDFGTATDETYGFEPYLTRSNRKSKKNR